MNASASLSVPVIDISSWFDGSPASRAAIAGDVDRACRTSGFFQVVGHGVSDQLIATLLDEIDTFFHLPLEIKSEVRPTENAVNRGFLPLGSEALSYTPSASTHPPTSARCSSSAPTMSRTTMFIARIRTGSSNRTCGRLDPPGCVPR